MVSGGSKDGIYQHSLWQLTLAMNIKAPMASQTMDANMALGAACTTDSSMAPSCSTEHMQQHGLWQQHGPWKFFKEAQSRKPAALHFEHAVIACLSSRLLLTLLPGLPGSDMLSSPQLLSFYICHHPMPLCHMQDIWSTILPTSLQTAACHMCVCVCVHIGSRSLVFKAP